MESQQVVMDWPAKSPDMNCIENMWGELVRRVYSQGRQFDTVDDLREALMYEWEKIDLPVVQNLIASMPRRVVELMVQRGGVTKY